MSKKKWTREACYEEAKKYTTVYEFSKGCGSAYYRARKEGWVKEYTWFVDGHKRDSQRRIKWTYETCRKESQKYKSRGEFSKGNPPAYQVALKNKWLDSYTWLISKGNKHEEKIDNVYAYFFPDLYSVYIGRTVYTERRNVSHNNDRSSTVNKFAHKNNIPIPEMTILESGLTVEEGLEREDYYVNKYREEGWNVLNKAKTGKRSGSIGAIGGGKCSRTYCFKEAQKYKTLLDFIINSGSVYAKARNNGWLKDYTWLKRKKHKNGYWCYETCYIEAIKYKSRWEFGKANGSAYNVARTNGWLDEWFPKTKRA